jgi:hypothetical protein
MANLTVGKGQQFATISSAVAASHDGDVIQVQAGTYTNDFAEIKTKITLEGVGGMVNMVATEPLPSDKGILVTDTDVTIDHFSFSGATGPSGNDAGIRYQGGALVLTNDYFHDNQNGLLANPSTTGTISIANSEFAHNGSGDGFTHNLYVGDIAKLTITDSYFHDAVVGHEIKSRAEVTDISNTRVFDNSGSASYSIDLPNGGQATLTGNTIEQGPNSQNPTIVAYGEEGGLHANSSLTMTNNTVLNDLSKGTLLLDSSNTKATVSGTSVWNLADSQMVSGSGATVTGTTHLGSEPALNTSDPWAATGSGGTGGGTGGGGTGGGSTGGGGTGGGTSGGGTAVTTGAASYTAPAGVTDITLTGSHQAVYLNNAGDTVHANDTGSYLFGGTGSDVFDFGRGGDWAAGGGGNDTFVFASTPWAAGGVTDFNTGDTVDLTGLLHGAGYAGSDPVGAGYLKITDDGQGDAQIWSHLNSTWWLTTTLQHVTASQLQVQGDDVVMSGSGGGTGGTGGGTGGGATGGGSAVTTGAATYTAPAGVTDVTLTGSYQAVHGNNLGDTFHSDNNVAYLFGGTGNDTFNLGRGGDWAAGGGGNDVFAFSATPWAAGGVTDFTAGDKVDLTGLLASSGYTGADPIGAGVIKITDDGQGDAQIWSHLNSTWWQVTTLQHVQASSLHMSGAFITE